MTKTPQSSGQGLKLKEICARLQVDYDDARYVLSLGVLPEYATDAAPGRGNHRVFNDPQAMMLAVILKLRAAGVSTAVTRQIAEWPKTVLGRSGWDPRITSLANLLALNYEVFLDVGDAQWVRAVANSKPTANPTPNGNRKFSPTSDWIDMTTRRIAAQARPAVIIRIDITQIAQQLMHEPTHRT